MTTYPRLFCGCARAHHARGLCAAHYARWRRTGSIQRDVPIRRRVVVLCGCAQPELEGARCTVCNRPNLAAMLTIGQQAYAEGVDTGSGPALAVVRLL